MQPAPRTLARPASVVRWPACRPLLAALLVAGLVAGCGGAGPDASSIAGTPASPTAARSPAPAGIAEARRVLDLAAFPLPEGAELTARPSLAAIRFFAPGAIESVFASTRDVLVGMGWKQAEGGFVSEQSATGVFDKAGFIVSLKVMQDARSGRSLVSLQQHGNLHLEDLPKPAGLSKVFESPYTAIYSVAAEPPEAAVSLRSTLTSAGWEPYGDSGDTAYFRQNAILVRAMTSVAPGQDGRTTYSFSTSLLSAEVPAPENASNLQFDDAAQGLRFTSEAALADLIQSYGRQLDSRGWRQSLEKPTRTDGKWVMVWRNEADDMLRLEFEESRGGMQNALISYQSEAQIAEMNRRLDEQAEAFKAARGS